MKRAFDRERAVFHSQLIAVAKERYYASVSGVEAEPFIGFLYARYQADLSPRDIGRWLESELVHHFRWTLKPPRWVRGQPAWPFAYGRPMVFVSQCALPMNSVTKETLAWGTELFVFAVRGPHGAKLEYRVVEQEHDLD